MVVVVAAYLRTLEVEETLISNTMKNKHKAAKATVAALQEIVFFILLVRKGLGCRQCLFQKRSDQFSAAIYIYIYSQDADVGGMNHWRTTRTLNLLLDADKI